MIFQNYVPNSHVPDFLEFLINALSTTSHSKSANPCIVQAILIMVLHENLLNQRRIQTYFDSIQRLWAPKNTAQVFLSSKNWLVFHAKNGKKK